MAQTWSPPTTPSRWLPVICAVALLTLIAPVLAVVSFFGVAFSVEHFLTREEGLCRTYACGDGVVWVIIFFSLGWMCVIWIAGTVAAAVAVRKTVSIGRAVFAALITASVVTVIAVAVDFAWVIWSV